MSDAINPQHYKSQSGVECIDVAEVYPYNIANAIKYAWRAGRKDDLLQDLKKCEWYIRRAYARADDRGIVATERQFIIAQRAVAKHSATLVDNEAFEGQRALLYHLVRASLEDAALAIERAIKSVKG